MTDKTESQTLTLEALVPVDDVLISSQELVWLLYFRDVVSELTQNDSNTDWSTIKDLKDPYRNPEYYEGLLEVYKH